MTQKDRILVSMADKKIQLGTDPNCIFFVSLCVLNQINKQ